MEKLNITDEEARLCRVEDALHDIAQRLTNCGLPLTQSCQSEINRMLSRQETCSSIYIRFSAEDRMFGDDIATLRICTNPDFQRYAVDPEGNEFYVENLTFQVETRQINRPATMAVQHARQYLQVTLLADELTQQFDGKLLYRLYQTAEAARIAQKRADQNKIKRWIEDGAASGLRVGQFRVVPKVELPSGKYEIETQNRGYAVNVYDDGSGAFIRRTR